MAAVSPLFLTIGVLLGLTTLTGILANVSVLLVVYWNRSLQNQINMLLVNLAVADLGVAASCVPFAITTVFLQSNVSVVDMFCFHTFPLLGAENNSFETKRHMLCQTSWRFDLITCLDTQFFPTGLLERA